VDRHVEQGFALPSLWQVGQARRRSLETMRLRVPLLISARPIFIISPPPIMRKPRFQGSGFEPSLML
jgi:hypothetical protein